MSPLRFAQIWYQSLFENAKIFFQRSMIFKRKVILRKISDLITPGLSCYITGTHAWFMGGLAIHLSNAGERQCTPKNWKSYTATDYLQQLSIRLILLVKTKKYNYRFYRGCNPAAGSIYQDNIYVSNKCIFYYMTCRDCVISWPIAHYTPLDRSVL